MGPLLRAAGDTVATCPTGDQCRQLPTDADRPRRILSAAEVEAMRTPREGVQQPLIEAADRIRVLVDAQDDRGFADRQHETTGREIGSSVRGQLGRPVDDVGLNRVCRA